MILREAVVEYFLPLRYIIAWPVVWTLYYVGHWISLLMELDVAWIIRVVYYIYNKLMLASYYVQEKLVGEPERFFPWKTNQDGVYSEGDCY